MQALENLTHQEASAVQFLLTDVDDTITTDFIGLQKEY